MVAGQQADLFIGCWFHVVRERVQKEVKYFVTSIEELKNILS
jgi:hypothetical protein